MSARTRCRWWTRVGDWLRWSGAPGGTAVVPTAAARYADEAVCVRNLRTVQIKATNGTDVYLSSSCRAITGWSASGTAHHSKATAYTSRYERACIQIHFNRSSLDASIRLISSVRRTRSRQIDRPTDLPIDRMVNIIRSDKLFSKSSLERLRRVDSSHELFEADWLTNDIRVSRTRWYHRNKCADRTSYHSTRRRRRTHTDICAQNIL